MIVLAHGVVALLGLFGPQLPPRGAGRARPIIFSAAPAPALPRISLADGRPANRGLSSEHRARLNTLLRHMSERSDGAEAAALVWDAFRFSYRYHYKQRRASGEPYITHPLEVASILADLAIDVPSVLTGLLHDTVEDTGATLDDIEGRYGGEVARLVNAVTKLDRLELRQAILNGNGNGLGGGSGGGKSASEAAELDEAAAINRYLPEEAREPSAEQKLAENLRKLVLAMSEDVRVLVIKLVDRLHNMRTLGYVASAESRQRKARETLQIYAPLADRIGMRRLAKELQALGFEVLQPAQAQTIRSLQALTRKSDVLATIERELNQAMARQGIAATLEVSARARDGQRPLPLPRPPPLGSHPRARPAAQVREVAPYRVWLRRRQLTHWSPNLRDFFHFVLVLDSKPECYRALGVVSRRRRPRPPLAPAPPFPLPPTLPLSSSSASRCTRRGAPSATSRTTSRRRSRTRTSRCTPPSSARRRSRSTSSSARGRWTRWRRRASSRTGARRSTRAARSSPTARLTAGGSTCCGASLRRPTRPTTSSRLLAWNSSPTRSSASRRAAT